MCCCYHVLYKPVVLQTLSDKGRAQVCNEAMSLMVAWMQCHSLACHVIPVNRQATSQKSTCQATAPIRNAVQGRERHLQVALLPAVVIITGDLLQGGPVIGAGIDCQLRVKTGSAQGDGHGARGGWLERIHHILKTQGQSFFYHGAQSIADESSGGA